MRTGVKGAMFIVCDQPGLTAGTFARMLEMGKMHRERLYVPDGKEEPGILHYGIRAFSGSCADFPVIKAENRSSVQ